MALLVGRVEVGTTATRLDLANQGVTNRCSITVRNRDIVPIFIGNADVTASIGFQVDPGESISVDIIPPQALFAVTAVGVATCHIIQLTV